MRRFDELLKLLAEAKTADADLHRRTSSLEERARSHDKLAAMRAEMACVREESGLDPGSVTNQHQHTRRVQRHG